jgi:gamma-glutamyltranspeptidase
VVGGIPISDVAGTQQDLMATSKPGDRLPSALAPSITLAGNKPVLVTATIGWSVNAEAARVLLGILAYHDSPQTAFSGPPLFDCSIVPTNSSTLRLMVPEDAYPPRLLNKLAASGPSVTEIDQASVHLIRGTTALGTIDAKTGLRTSVEDPSINSFAEGY